MIRALHGDCRDVLPTLAAGSVHCVVTSPPYFGLRDYGTAAWEGGEAGCDHRAPDEAGATTKPTKGQREHAGRFSGPTCWRCGARRVDQQIGLEPTPDAYVAELVAVFREVWRVLRDDGNVWLNLGDSYNNFRSQMGPGQALHGRDNLNGKPAIDSKTRGWGGLKEKDLMMIPARVALALQADGWFLRSDIIWAKPNPMPESVTDRPTSAHEHVFLLTKRARYFYDAEAVKERSLRAGDMPGGNNERGKGEFGVSPHAAFNGTVPEFRNLRNVWTIASQPFAEAHFATFPPALVEPCIKAGCPVGGTVLDPFAGAGTVGLVADRLGRDAVLIELNGTYDEIARARIVGDAPLFAVLKTEVGT